MPCESNIEPRLADTRTGAAGVSPPWYGNAIATVFVHRPLTGRLRATIAIQPLRARFQNHGWLTPAALGCTCAYCCRTALPVSESLPIPRGAYAPRSCAAMRMSAGEKTIFAMHKRTCTRAAGVSPPWVGEDVYADTSAIAQRTAERMCADHHCHRVRRYHGGLTPPALVLRCECLPAKKRFLRCTNAHAQERRASARRGPHCAARTVHSEICPANNDCRIRSGGCQPAVVWYRNCNGVRAQTTDRSPPGDNCDPAAASVFPKPRLAHASRSWLHVRLLLQNCVARERVASHTTGGLRPPLLCCDANVCRRKNDFCDAQTHRKNGRNVFLRKEAELRGLLWKISGILATAFLWKAALNTGTWSG
jgi:hypothetical protein